MQKPERQTFAPVKGSRTHANCKSQTGVNRPGKTAKDNWRPAGERDD